MKVETRAMQNRPAFIASLAAAALLAGCAENPVKPVTIKDKVGDSTGGKQPVVLSLLQSSSLDVSGFQKKVSSLDKVSKVMGGAGPKDIKVEVGLQGIGGGGTKAPAMGKGKMGGGTPRIISGLLKRSAPLAKQALAKRALAKRAADFILDTAWIDSSTAGKGYVTRIHHMVDDDPRSGFTFSDTTVYKVPYNDTDDTQNLVMYESEWYKYADGSLDAAITADADGDNILNAAAHGRTALVLETSTWTMGDTVRKSVELTDHGNPVVYDSLGGGSLGEGRQVSSTDSTFVKGKIDSWSKTTDGDGDGFAGAEPGRPAKLKYESWFLDSAGNVNISWNGYGSGPDNDISTWEDNTTLPSSSITLDSKGDTTARYSQEDLDGDGIINGFAAGMNVQVKSSSWYKYGDTVTRSVYVEDYGKRVLMDSLWRSNPVSWTDTTWIKGQITYWHKSYDGDGDGLINTAAPGKTVMVKDDSYSKWDDSTFNLSSAAYGAGPDKDYTAWEDNEQYPSTSQNTDAKGVVTAKYAYGDADGDGYYYAKGAANKVWEANQYFNQDGQKAYKDSTVKLIGDITTNDDDKVLFNTAAVEYLDGSASLITTKSKSGKETFGEKDTIVASEKYTYTNYVPKDNEDRTGDMDSSLTVTYIIPNDLAKWEDDEVVWWSHKSYYKKSLSTVFSSELLTTRKPFLSGTDPVAGTYEREEKYSASAETEVNRWREWSEFDNSAGASSWRQIHYYVRGDSTVETGSQLSEQEGTYAKNWDDSTRNTGWYNTKTHEFKDTIVYLKAKDKDPAKDISWGTYNDSDGTGDYSWKQYLANGDSAGPTTRTIVKKLGDDDHMEITTITGEERGTYKTHKDTTIWEDDSDSVKTVYSSVSREDGSYILSQETKDAKGTVLMKGSFVFLPDGSGYGSLVEYKDGTAQTPVTLKFELDGTTYVDGVAVTDEPTGDNGTGDASTDGGSASGV